jgi:hypothetical protein
MYYVWHIGKLPWQQETTEQLPWRHDQCEVVDKETLLHSLKSKYIDK